MQMMMLDHSFLDASLTSLTSRSESLAKDNSSLNDRLHESCKENTRQKREIIKLSLAQQVQTDEVGKDSKSSDQCGNELTLKKTPGTTSDAECQTLTCRITELETELLMSTNEAKLQRDASEVMKNKNVALELDLVTLQKKMELEIGALQQQSTRNREQLVAAQASTEGKERQLAMILTENLSLVDRLEESKRLVEENSEEYERRLYAVTAENKSMKKKLEDMSKIQVLVSEHRRSLVERLKVLQGGEQIHFQPAQLCRELLQHIVDRESSEATAQAPPMISVANLEDSVQLEGAFHKLASIKTRTRQCERDNVRNTSCRVSEWLTTLRQQFTAASQLLAQLGDSDLQHALSVGSGAEEIRQRLTALDAINRVVEEQLENLEMRNMELNVFVSGIEEDLQSLRERLFGSEGVTESILRYADLFNYWTLITNYC